jgi:hypothetical protein
MSLSCTAFEAKPNNTVTLVCLACPHTETVKDFNGDIGNQRILAARAMLEHVRAEHSRETHLRTRSMVMAARTPIASRRSDHSSRSGPVNTSS